MLLLLQNVHHSLWCNRVSFQANNDMLCYMQSGMHEETSDIIELGGMDGPVLEALMAFLYGSMAEIPAKLLLPLYVAADAHQV